MKNDMEVDRLHAEVRRLAAELEQARVTAEDAQLQVNNLNQQCRTLVSELRERRKQQIVAEEALVELRERSADPDPPAGQVSFDEDRLERSTIEEELRVTVEELQVVAEELDAANEALRRSNGELEQRVEQRTAELAASNARLADAEQRLRLGMRHADAGMWEWDLIADTMSCSEEFCDLCGCRPDEATTLHSWLGLVVPEDRKRVERALRDCVEFGVPALTVEYRIERPDRSDRAQRAVRWLAGRGRVIFDAGGRPARLLGLSIDITERKSASLALERLNVELSDRVEREVAARKEAQSRQFQRQKLEALGHLTGGVAHDFNNLLMVVVSGIDMMARSEDPAQRNLLAQRVLDAAEKGAELTRRLLAFGRRQELRSEPLNVVEYMGNLQNLLSQSLRGDIRIRARCPQPVWPVKIDVGALELALLNLAVNARDAMPRGGVLTLSAFNRHLDAESSQALGLPEGDYVELSVTDEGTGMTPEVLGRVFEPFYTTKPPGKGSGLGLAQVYGFARQSGGTATVQSAVDQGTTVTLVLPRSMEAAAAPAPPRPALMTLQACKAPSIAGTSVLVVEDDDEVAGLVTELLCQFGCEVTRVATAAAALGVMGNPKRRIDLVFTDVLLPGGLSGLDLARELSEHEPAPPIVLTSGYLGDVEPDEALTHLPLLRKPYTLAALREVLEAALGERPDKVPPAHRSGAKTAGRRRGTAHRL